MDRERDTEGDEQKERETETSLTSTILDISIGNMERGNLKMLNKERATKAFSAVSLSSGLVLLRWTSEYVANVAKAT